MNQEENPNDTETVSPQVDPKDRFIDLVTNVERLKKEMKQASTELEQIQEILGEGTMIQDPTDLTVYRITKPDGRWVEYFKYGYDRTKKAGERQGTLSQKDALAAGFILPG